MRKKTKCKTITTFNSHLVNLRCYLISREPDIFKKKHTWWLRWSLFSKFCIKLNLGPIQWLCCYMITYGNISYIDMSLYRSLTDIIFISINMAVLFSTWTNTKEDATVNNLVQSLFKASARKKDIGIHSNPQENIPCVMYAT